MPARYATPTDPDTDKMVASQICESALPYSPDPDEVTNNKLIIAKLMPEPRRKSLKSGSKVGGQGALASFYRFGFTAASLRPELLFIIAERFLQTGSWDKTKDSVLSANELQCRTATSAQRMERELRPRLQTLSRHQLELLVRSGADTRISLAWLAAVKHSSFLFDFAADAIRSKVERHDFVLRESDYRRFIEEKTPSHPELVKLSDLTSGKVRRVLFAMLREAGILAKGEEIGSLHRPVIPHEVELSIRAENPLWLAAYLVPESEIKTHLPTR